MASSRIDRLALVWVAIAAVAVAAAVFQLSTVLIAIPIVAGVLAQIISGRNEKKRTRIERLRGQIELLYGPEAARVKTILTAPIKSPQDSNFQDHMERVLGELHRHLAAPATLAAYDELERQGLWGGEAERKLAQAFLDDHARLVAEYRRLTGGAS